MRINFSKEEEKMFSGVGLDYSMIPEYPDRILCFAYGSADGMGNGESASPEMHHYHGCAGYSSGGGWLISSSRTKSRIIFTHENAACGHSTYYPSSSDDCDLF